MTQEEIEKRNKRHFKRISQTANKAMKDYLMLEDGDRILIGLSGGKDSLALVEVLAARQRIFKPKIEVVACHISVDNVPYKSRIEYLEEFCSERGVEFIHARTSFATDEKEGRAPCFLCSWNRRKMLFKVAEEQRCNKIAFGHHKDDIVETLLMNQIFQGAMATMPPVLKMNKIDVSIIRPLALVREKELQLLADYHNYEKQVKNCPYEKVSNRPKVREILELMEELNPNAVGSLWGAMTNIQKEYLP